MESVATPLPKVKTFFNCHLMMDLISLTLPAADSVSYITIGNLPILFKTFPNNLGIYLIKDSEAIN